MSAGAASPVFSPRAVLLMLLAGVFSFSAYFVLSAYAPDLRSGDDGGAHALSKSAVGYAGLVRLLNATGAPARVSRIDPKAIKTPAALMVLTPGPATSELALDEASGRAAATLVVLPKWRTAPLQTNPGWVQALGAVSSDALTQMLTKRFGKVTISRRTDNAPLTLDRVGESGAGMAAGPVNQLQTVKGPGLTPVLVDQDGEAVLARADNDVFLLSDPDLLNTQGLKNLATARAAVAMIEQVRAGDGPIVFDVTLDGYGGGQSLLKLAFEPPFLGATLCLAAVALLMGLHAASRFGAPRQEGRVLALGKEALAESSAGLIRMARREPHMAAGYLDLCRAQAAQALGAGRLTSAELDAFLDAQGERIGAGRLSEIAAETRAPKDRAGLLAAATRLYRWRLEMTRERS